MRLDLTGAILPDVAFDPNGAAGDTAGKPFTVDGTTPVGLVGHALSGPHDGGYDALEINFNGFDPGETFNFSIDVDPTSIRGVAPSGPEDVGNIAGLELTGTQVTVTFDDGTVWSDNLFRTPGSPNFSQSILRSRAPARPGISLVGVTTPATVGSASQTVRVTGPVGASVALLVAEAALLTAGVPNGGFDLDPYEGNNVIGFVEADVVIGAGRIR